MSQQYKRFQGNPRLGLTKKYNSLIPRHFFFRFTLLLDFNVVDPSQSLAFPMNVMALLPYMVQNYEDANETCIISAENIAQVITIPI
jgi:hypothetical protein